MEITEVRVKIVDESSEKLLGFCTITFDHEFVVRDLKIIHGPRGPFVAMPSRKLTDRCRNCGNKNHLRARYCSDCGKELDPNRAGKDERGRAKLHTDIAHPINMQARTRVEAVILEEYRAELDRSRQPGYVPPRLGADYDDPPPRRRNTPPPGGERTLAGSLRSTEPGQAAIRHERARVRNDVERSSHSRTPSRGPPLLITQAGPSRSSLDLGLEAVGVLPASPSPPISIAPLRFEGDRGRGRRGCGERARVAGRVFRWVAETMG